MDDICNVVFLRYVMSQNKMAETLYREPLREIVVHYDKVSELKKGRGEVYTV